MVTVGYLHRLGRQRKEFFALARAQRDELSHELKVAGEVQRRLLESNQAARPELDFHAWADPLKAVGGDYYDLWSPDEGRTIVVVADVAGKGLPAAMLMPALRIAVRSAAARHEEPARAALGARTRPAREVVTAIREEWTGFRDGDGNADDTTVIALRRAHLPQTRP